MWVSFVDLVFIKACPVPPQDSFVKLSLRMTRTTRAVSTNSAGEAGRLGNTVALYSSGATRKAGRKGPCHRAAACIALERYKTYQYRVLQLLYQEYACLPLEMEQRRLCSVLYTAVLRAVATFTEWHSRRCDAPQPEASWGEIHLIARQPALH